MDSTTVLNGETVTGAMEMFDRWLPQIIGIVVLPIAIWLSRFGFAEYMPPRIIKGVLAIGSAFALAAILKIDMPIGEIVDTGLAAVGTATVIYGGGEIGKAIKKKKGSK